MPIKRIDLNVSQHLSEMAERFREACLNNLTYVGEQAVNEARQRGRYKDQTGNLRSSIGYCVLEDGKIIKESSFDAVKNGAQGSLKGRDFLHRLVSENQSGLVLIVVAGMEYAAYVEAKNLNVLDSAEQLAERLLPQLLKSLKL